jgi:hypothetical protein
MGMKLLRTDKIAKADAKELILCMVRYGNHSQVSFGPDTSDAAVKSAFQSKGHDFDQIIERARSPTFIIPRFENLLGSTMATFGGGSVSIVQSDGSHEVVLSGDGQFTLEPYWAAYEGSSWFLAEAAKTLSVECLLAASQRAVASVEGFIAERVQDWNRTNRQDQLDPTKKVKFDEKIDDWIPMMTGQSLDKSGRNWCDFQKLRRFRDKMATHQSGSPRGIKSKEFVEIVNLFRCGAAGILLDLHKLFKVKAPSRIIREAFAPHFVLEK